MLRCRCSRKINELVRMRFTRVPRAGVAQGKSLIRDSRHLARKEQRDLSTASLRAGETELIDHPNLLGL